MCCSAESGPIPAIARASWGRVAKSAVGQWRAANAAMVVAIRVVP